MICAIGSIFAFKGPSVGVGVLGLVPAIAAGS